MKYDQPTLVKFIRHLDAKIKGQNYYIIRDVVNGNKFFLLNFFLKNDSTIAIRLFNLFNDSLMDKIIFYFQNINNINTIQCTPLSTDENASIPKYLVDVNNLDLLFITQEPLDHETIFNPIKTDCLLCSGGHDFLNCTFWSQENFETHYNNLEKAITEAKKKKN